ncbi:hypothetical protein CUJ83_12720 [Methanocella sp. CWC-04]|uniref:DUF4013 domain-containing protein n=1 Tax=Methanooceanicella nereidis TaxID=2052831 RepID=A0AAP2W835_9EURY|nr:DUF4013 domain-containing protein [Methanocella sp. CWC-04]MCD1295859.1 hypothetical protein [Methanocella sp. CWC-04]
MEQNEGFIDAMVNSIKYGVSDLGAFLIGGLFTILSAFIIGIPFLLGYITRCGKELIKGNGKMPAWDDWGGLFKDGLVVILLAIVYALVIGLLYVLVCPLFIAGDIFNSNIMLAAGVIFLLPIMLIGGLLGLLFYLSWLVYAATGDLGKALNPLNGIKLFMTEPLGYIGVLVGTFLIGIFLSVLGAIVITAPWTGFLGTVSGAYLYVWFYKKAILKGANIA